MTDAGNGVTEALKRLGRKPSGATDGHPQSNAWHLGVLDERQSVANLVRAAVDDYLARHLGDETLWRERLDTLLTRVRTRVPAGTSSEEIEADVSVTRDEVRQMHRAARRR